MLAKYCTFARYLVKDGGAADLRARNSPCSAGQPNDKSVLHSVLSVEDVVDLCILLTSAYLEEMKGLKVERTLQ